MRKPQSTSVLKTLQPDRQRQIWEWKQEGNSLEKIVELIKSEWGIETWPSSLSVFLHWYPFASQLEEARTLQDDVTEYLKSNPNLDLDSEQISKVGQVIYEKQAIKAQNPKLYIELRKLRQKDRDQAAVERRLAALEAKAKQATETLTDGSLNPEQRQQRMKEIFGIS